VASLLVLCARVSGAATAALLRLNALPVRNAEEKLAPWALQHTRPYKPNPATYTSEHFGFLLATSTGEGGALRFPPLAYNFPLSQMLLAA